MSRLTHELYVRLRQAQALIREHGWVQHTLGDELGGYCMYGALCRTGLDGLHIVARRLVMMKAHVSNLEQYNDAIVLNRFEAIQALDILPTPEMLQAAYGPHWEAVIGLIRQVAHLTPDQFSTLAGTADGHHHMHYRALLAASSNQDTRPFVDRVLEDVHLAIPGRDHGICWAILDQVAVTQLAWKPLNRGQLAITIDDLAPANVAFANLIGVK